MASACRGWDDCCPRPLKVQDQKAGGAQVLPGEGALQWRGTTPPLAQTFHLAPEVGTRASVYERVKAAQAPAYCNSVSASPTLKFSRGASARRSISWQKITWTPCAGLRAGFKY